MVITATKANRMMNFAVFSFLRQYGNSKNMLAPAIEYAQQEFCAFCEVEGITEVDADK